MISQPPLNPDALEEAAKELFLEDENTAYVKYPEWDSPENVGKPVYIENARAAVSAYLASAEPELAARAEQAEQAVQRVRELHEEYVIYAWDGEVNFPKLDANGQKVVLARLCRACSSEDGIGAAEDGEWDDGYDDVDYPCPTIHALDGDPRAEV